MKTKPKTVPITWIDIAWKARVRKARIESKGLRIEDCEGRGMPAWSTERGASAVVATSGKFAGGNACATRPWLGTRRQTFGFTLIELLVVIAIIAILAALLLPAIAHAKVTAQKKQAGLDVRSIVNAVQKYEADNNRLPLPPEVMGYATTDGSGADFTYGTAKSWNLPSGAAYNTSAGPFKNGVDVMSLKSDGVTPLLNAEQRNNAELMAILMDIDNFGNGITRDSNHALNRSKNKYLTAKMSGDFTSGGVGQDGVYRDPWKQPYIVTLDANSDEKCRDAFYQSAVVSADQSSSTTPKKGFNGLIPVTVGPNTFYEINQQVAAWSAGPDMSADSTKPATQDVNKDNVTSW